MKRTSWVTACAASLAALALAAGYTPTVAQKSGHGGGSSSGGAAVGGGGVVGGGSTGSSGRAFSSGRSFTGWAPRAFVNRGDVRRHGRHFRRGRVFGFAPYYDDYGYSGCGYYHRRAVATGSRYWWRRYRECIGD